VSNDLLNNEHFTMAVVLN